jgi:uncharacterized glyoxalase superfamily protein PhnB
VELQVLNALAITLPNRSALQESARFYRDQQCFRRHHWLRVVHLSDTRDTREFMNAFAPPSPLTAQKLQASLTVNDLPTSLAWYRDVIGFAVNQEHVREGKLRAVSLKAGDVEILIGQDDGAKGFDRVKGAGFSLQLTTTQDIDELAIGIRKRGGTLASEPADMPWGARVFRVRDPDGFTLVISSPR